MKKIIEDYTYNISTIRDFVNTIRMFLNEKDKEMFEKKVQPLIPFIAVLQRSMTDRGVESGKLTHEKYHELFNGKFEISSDKDKYTLSIKDSGPNKEAIKEISKNPKPFIENLLKMPPPGRNHELLYKSALMSLTSAVEFFFSELIRFHLSKYPEIVNSSEKKYTYSDLLEFKNLDEIKERTVDDYIESLIRGRVEDWSKYFCKMQKTNLSAVNERNKSKMVEIFARRNLYAHNQGVVNSQYLSRVEGDFKAKYKVGDKLKTDFKYVSDAINNIETYFLGLAFSYWKHVDKKSEERSNLFTEYIYERLKSKNYIETLDLCEILLSDSQIDEETKIVARFNAWTALKMQGKIEDSHKAEIKALDLSAASKKFVLARYALMDENDDFFSMLTQCLKSEEVNVDDLREWPILENMRKDERMRPIIADKPTQKHQSNQVSKSEKKIDKSKKRAASKPVAKNNKDKASRK